MIRGALTFAVVLAVAAAPAGGAERMDPRNPTCPESPDWGPKTPMKFSLVEREGKRVLLGEGVIDEGLVARLKAALDQHKPDEIWLRSAGGNARAGNAAGKLIRESPMVTRIPSGWACFSACNFVFMGGRARFVDPGGLFMVHMFTHTADRSAIEAEVLRGTENTVGLIGDIEQDSALLASEDNDFLIRMGVSRKLLTEVMYQQKAVADSGGSTRRCLTQQEALKYNVANAQ
ncbi:MAG TPA: hypothetical protein VF718_00040 [Allosphingosinicella sp.]|jgi:hypothetical protein